MRKASITFGMILALGALCLNVNLPVSAGTPPAVNPRSQVMPQGEFWQGRWGFQLVSHGDSMLVVGGQNESGYRNDIWARDLQ